MQFSHLFFILIYNKPLNYLKFNKEALKFVNFNVNFTLNYYSQFDTLVKIKLRHRLKVKDVFLRNSPINLT